MDENCIVNTNDIILKISNSAAKNAKIGFYCTLESYQNSKTKEWKCSAIRYVCPKWVYHMNTDSAIN